MTTLADIANELEQLKGEKNDHETEVIALNGKINELEKKIIEFSGARGRKNETTWVNIGGSLYELDASKPSGKRVLCFKDLGDRPVQ